MSLRDAEGHVPESMRQGTFLACRVSVDDHLTVESSERNTSNQQLGDGMLKASANRGVFVRAVCLLSIALVCVMGFVQATHSHSENSATSHHACSICATAHVGLNTAPVASAPVLVTTALASSVAEVSLIFRSVTTQFIRPPPAF
jgi:hypothetical protein